MNLEQWNQLRSDQGQALLGIAQELEPIEATFLRCFQSLEKKYPRELVKIALEMALLRSKATNKFRLAQQMYFTKEALEQSSGEMISRYRAERFASFDSVLDGCCSIGGDTLGLAQQTQVLAVDLDPLRLAMAQENLRVYGLVDRCSFQQGDLLQISLANRSAMFVDPDRRADGRRHIPIREYAPSLSALQQRLPKGYPFGVKVAPAVSWQELESLDAEVEFISVQGEVKECVLWFGPLQTIRRRATLLPGRYSFLASQPAAKQDPVRPKSYLYEPDGAILRAGLVTNLGEALQMQQIDAETAFLTSDQLIDSPFVTGYQIEAAIPFHVKRLNEYLRKHAIGRINVIRRGSPVSPEELQRQLKLSGTEHRLVILTRVLEEPFLLIALPATKGI